MSIRCALLGLAAFGLLSTSANGQNQGPPAGRSAYRSRTERASRLRNSPKLILGATSKRGTLGTFASSRTTNMMTRTDQLRLMMPQRSRYQSTTGDPTVRPSPIKNMLARRNLLSTRSPLAQMTTATIGRNDYLSDDKGGMKGDLSLIVKQVQGATAQDMRLPDDGRFQDSMAARAAKRADEYFALGQFEFRQRHWDRARDYFELVKSAQASHPRGYLGVFLTTVHTTDLLVGDLNLLRAIDRAKTIDDLRLNREEFYSDPTVFQGAYEALSLAADAYPDNPTPNLLLVYLAWWNGDLGTAKEAVERVQKNVPKDMIPKVTKLSDLLIGVQEGAAKATSAPTSRP